jgi:hypothetical protein
MAQIELVEWVKLRSAHLQKHDEFDCVQSILCILGVNRLRLNTRR